MDKLKLYTKFLIHPRYPSSVQLLLLRDKASVNIAKRHVNCITSLFQHAHWVNLFSATEQDDIQSLTETERKRREAVWELFQSECVFLIDHLMVLKHVRLYSCSTVIDSVFRCAYFDFIIIIFYYYF